MSVADAGYPKDARRESTTVVLCGRRHRCNDRLLTESIWPNDDLVNPSFLQWVPENHRRIPEV